MPWAVAAAGVSAAGGIAGSVISSNASKKAADAQTKFQYEALAQQDAERDYINHMSEPFIGAGYAALPALQNYYGNAQGQMQQAYGAVQQAIPHGMDQKTLEQTPGYQFNLSQGLRAVQNSAAAKGLGVSSTALNGAAKFATGLADSTYQNQWNNQQTQYTDTLNNANLLNTQLNNGYSYLAGPASLGANTLIGAGTQNVALTGQMANTLTNAGNATAAGITGAAAPYANALNGLGKDFGNAVGMYKYLNPGAFSGVASNSSYGYDPSAYGYNGDINSSGGQALTSMGLVNPLSSNY